MTEMTQFLDLSLGNSASDSESSENGSDDNEESEGSVSKCNEEVSISDEEVTDEAISASSKIDEVCRCVR